MDKIKTLLIVLFTFAICVNAHAEKWVCFDSVNGNSIRRVVEGDGKSLGICDINNSNIDPECILATDTEYTNAKKQFKKIDKAQSPGARVIDWTQTEIDDFNTAQTVAQSLSKRLVAKNQFNETQFKAFIKILINEINILRKDIDDMSKEVNQAVDRNRPARTIIQLRNAIDAEIDSGNSD